MKFTHTLEWPKRFAEFQELRPLETALGDIALNLATAKAFSFIGGLNLPDAASIPAHAAVGGVNAELSGGNFLAGAVSAGVGKGTTLGVDKFAPSSNIANGAVTITAGALAAELAGADPVMRAYTAGLGYAFNQKGNTLFSRVDGDWGLVEIGPPEPLYVDPMHPFFNPNNNNNYSIWPWERTHNPLFGVYRHPGADLRGYDINPFSGADARHTDPTP